jgi:hypothetical protein
MAGPRSRPHSCAQEPYAPAGEKNVKSGATVVYLRPQQLEREAGNTTALQNAVKRHCNETEFVEEAKTEMAALHTRLDEAAQFGGLFFFTRHLIR